MTTIDQEDWIIKFPAHVDRPDSGKMEYDYSLCAKKCGITMSETRLFPSKKCSGYFGTKRFDRIIEQGKSRKVHMLTAAALLELDFEQPSLDYHELLKLTKILTKNDPFVWKTCSVVCALMYLHTTEMITPRILLISMMRATINGIFHLLMI